MQRDGAFQAVFDRFSGLSETVDILADERSGARRWRWLMPDIAFIIPIDDEAVITQCQTWQRALGHYLDYDPQPAHRLHITLHYLGDLRRYFWQWRLTTWRRAALDGFVPHIRAALTAVPPFEVTIGPLNAFSSVLFAEVHDAGQLTALRARLLSALPRRAALLHPSQHYLPHITLGYWGKRAIAPLAVALEPYRQVDPLHLRIERVKFTTYARVLEPLRRDVLSTATEDIIAEYHLSE